MKKTIERMLSFILSAILTANLLSVPILADEATERENLYSNDELSAANEEIPSENNTEGYAEPEIVSGAGTDTGTGVGKENDSYSEIPANTEVVSAPSQNAAGTGDAGADASKGYNPSKDSSSLEADGAGESNENDGSFSFTLNENSSGNTVTIHQNDSLNIQCRGFSKNLSDLENLGNIYLSFILKDAVRLPMDFGGDYDSAMDRFDIPLKGTLNGDKTEVTFNGFNLYDYMLKNTNGIPVPAGTYQLRITAYYRPQSHSVDQSQYYWSNRDVKVEWQQTDGPTVTTESLHEGIFGTAYSSTLAATPKNTGNTVEWSIKPTFISQTDLRNMYGLSLTSDGTLSGTIPSGDGTSYAYVNIHFRATEKETGKYTDIFLPLKISHEGGLSINTYSLPMAALNWPYSAAIDVAPSSDLTFTIARSGDSPVPLSNSDDEWLHIDSSTGVLSGTPTAAGTYRYNVTVSKDNHQPKSRTYSITVRPAVIFQVTGLFDKEYASVYYSK
ncbi:MAG: putative Ig domain-containing protein, partial [Lachnospiraceae bacterium]|nr:putative Ig domain-containing protein [Lachnospiraceae bacterium]